MMYFEKLVLPVSKNEVCKVAKYKYKHFELQL